MLDKPTVASEDQAHALEITSAAGGNWRIPSDHATLQVDMGKPQDFGNVRFSTPYTDIAKLTFEAQDCAAWKTFYTVDNSKGNSLEATFSPVTAQVIRVTIASKKPGIRVSWWQMYAPF